MATRPLRILHAPLHHPASPGAGRMGVALHSSLAADSVGYTEAYKPAVRAWIATQCRLRGWRMVRGYGSDTTRGGLDNPVLTRKKWPSLGQLSVQISEGVDPAEYAPQRWLQCSMFDHPQGPIAHFGLHLNATVERRAEKSAIRTEYAESMRTVDRYVSLVRADGLLPVVTGDLNWRMHHDVAQPWYAPQTVFAKLGLQWWSDGLDWVAWDKRLRLDAHRVIPTSQTRSDHPWMLATLERR